MKRLLRARRLPVPGATGAVLAVLGVGYLLATGHAGPAAADTDNPAAILRGLADQAVAEHRLVAPAGRNAYEFYLSMRQLAPDDAAVPAAMRALFPQATVTVEAAINRGALDEAARELRLLREADPGNFTLALLGGKLDAQRQLVVRHDEALARARRAGGTAQPR